MREVLKEAAKTADGLDSDAVHDLRVALRRCRSLAGGFRAIDPDKNWKRMRRQASSLFDSLGELRDCHVMMHWVEQLGPRDDPITQTLAAHIGEDEPALKDRAATAIKRFDTAQWQSWIRILPRRVSHLPLGAEAFQSLAVEQLNFARRMQTPALKTRGASEFHRLRIEIKKFRYIVENFLPAQHQQWEKGLKLVQDLLGEIHDLDVLRDNVDRVATDEILAAPAAWRQILERERQVRVERYRDAMTGKISLWSIWRSGLPRGRAVRKASVKRLQAWSSFLDSDQQHNRRVARFAVLIHDGLSRLKILEGHAADDRELLRAASLVHEVGRQAGKRGHHKQTEKMVRGLERLAGWKRKEVMLMARIARFHRGALPGMSSLNDMPATEWQRIRILSGILRLANALDADHDGSIRSITVRKREGFVTIRAAGLETDSARAEHVAASRYLLETACGVPILVQPAINFIPEGNRLTRMRD
jgi:CHAD domain-containing protein